MDQVVLDDKSNEILLGFDIREVVYNEKSWSMSRRRSYLFRLDIQYPLSVDHSVFPSVFDHHNLPKPGYVGFYDDLWDDLGQLMKHFNVSCVSHHQKLYMIAVVLYVKGCTYEEKLLWDNQLRGLVYKNGGWIKSNVLAQANPSVCSSEWKFLGYDIADRWAVSSLSNCGEVLEKKMDIRREEWGMFLNKLHLFDDLDKAIAFKKFSDNRVKEHAPFFVYGIWMIDELSRL